MTPDRDARILILGIGNLLWADEGFGVRCVEEMASEWSFPDRVTLLDGGTQGLYLLPFLEDADALIVFDAVDYGMTPGALKVVRGDEVPAFLGAKKMSLHQTGFQEVVATADLLGRRPPFLMLVGVQPEELEDFGGGLRPLTASRIAPAIDVALTELRDRFGVVPAPRPHADAQLAHASLRRDAYEGGRPPADAACRVGDERFLARRS